MLLHQRAGQKQPQKINMRVTNTEYETTLIDKCHPCSTSRAPVCWRASFSPS